MQLKEVAHTFKLFIQNKSYESNKSYNDHNSDFLL